MEMLLLTMEDDSVSGTKKAARAKTAITVLSMSKLEINIRNGKLLLKRILEIKDFSLIFEFSLLGCHKELVSFFFLWVWICLFH